MVAAGPGRWLRTMSVTRRHATPDPGESVGCPCQQHRLQSFTELPCNGVVFDDATTQRTGGLRFGDPGSGVDHAEELHPLHPADAVRFVEAFAIGKGLVLREPVPDPQPRFRALRWR